jgi:uncharacterized protein YndB with AHSA1/START domain
MAISRLIDLYHRQNAFDAHAQPVAKRLLLAALFHGYLPGKQHFCISTKKGTMEAKQKILITVEAIIYAPLEKVWEYWTNPEHIVHWNNASDDWHTTKAENNLVAGGRFSSRMEAKDGSMGFDFWGVHDAVKTHECIESTLGDERKMSVVFSAAGNETKVVESFEAETENAVELQQGGWQAILNNFKKYAEASR